jgi:hypothetical protein
VLRYKGFFGHGYYQKIPILNGCAQMLGRHMVKHPVALFTSFAYVVLKKPFY